MNRTREPQLHTVFLCATVFLLIAHWPAFQNPFVINDDVRQQIYWMEKWRDPELFSGDLLSRYAQSYVPWGVQAIYYLGSFWMSPVQFSKVVTAALFLITTGLLFMLGTRLRDARLGLMTVLVSFFFPGFLDALSGGLSRSFVFPLLLAHLILLADGRIACAAGVILFQSFLNPYVFLLCLTTQAVWMARTLWRSRSGRGRVESCATIILANLPAMVGMGLIWLRYVVLKSPEFGEVVTWQNVLDKVELTDLGRYPVVPVPSILHELARPWRFFFPFDELGSFAGWSGLCLFAAVLAALLLIAARTAGPESIDPRRTDLAKLLVFSDLLLASVLLYGIAYLFLMRLFLPSRYLEYSLVVFYCVLLAFFLDRVGRALDPGARHLRILMVIATLLGGARNYHVSLVDCSQEAPLYRFLRTTPKNALVAGHPNLMDNVVTFARRKALVTYELSHPWYTRYWDLLRERTSDLFQAYYSQDPSEVRQICQRHRIDYLVVREEDFSSKRLSCGPVYFEPFNRLIRQRIGAGRRFVVLDRKRFPPTFECNGIRVLEPNR